LTHPRSQYSRGQVCEDKPQIKIFNTGIVKNDRNMQRKGAWDENS